jgi:hypothetical protein
MADKNVAVFGIYATRVAVERATEELGTAGFSGADISVLMPRNIDGSNDMGTEASTKAPEGAVTGGATGGAIGGALGALAGAGLLVIPGLGPFLAAGPIMAGLAGLGAGSVVGGIAGALIGMGLPEYEAKRYEGHVQNGGILISVHCDTDGEVTRAKEIMTSTGATHISSSSETGVEHAQAPMAETGSVKK